MKRNILLGLAGVFTVLTIIAHHSKGCSKEVFLIFFVCAFGSAYFSLKKTI
ncbi:MAG: hypothetical protein ISR98_02235 [Parcubacteria group bacterium]|nr:hypothetical protein [Parcubacteria group bacterium]